MIVHGHQVYSTYLAFKQHFTNPKFDFFQYDGKVKVKEETYQQSRAFWFCESLAKKLTDEEIKEYMLASFVSAEDSTKVWIRDIQRTGRDSWLVWQKQQACLSYTFEQDCLRLVNYLEQRNQSPSCLLQTMGGHPPCLRLYCKREISLETLIILDMVLNFMVDWDDKLIDPLWQSISMKIKKYKPFLSINTMKYRGMIKKAFL